MTTATPTGLTVVVPAYNEEGAIAGTVREIHEALTADGVTHEIIVVDDGSTDGTAARLAAIGLPGLVLKRHARNRGYGASLKTGVKAARHDLVAITDADGTYPNARLPELRRLLEEREADMIVGARLGRSARIPLIRRPAKWCINQLANWLSGERIPDLNSGLRVFRKASLLEYLHLLPDGFSFTTTITLAMLTTGRRVEYVPIDYAARIGQSKIRPIRDTLAFMQLIIRTVLLFEPLRVFLPVSLLLFASGVGVFLYSWLHLPRVLDMTSALLIIGALQLLAVGMLADMINRRLGR